MRPERTDFGRIGIGAVESLPLQPSKTTRNFRRAKERGTGLREVGGAKGTGVEQSLGRKSLILRDVAFKCAVRSVFAGPARSAR